MDIDLTPVLNDSYAVRGYAWYSRGGSLQIILLIARNGRVGLVVLGSKYLLDAADLHSLLVCRWYRNYTLYLSTN